jgi:hypothetical protein
VVVESRLGGSDETRKLHTVSGKRIRRRRRTKVQAEEPSSGELRRKLAAPQKPGGRRAVRIALATQLALLRDMLSQLLNNQPDLQVVAEERDED